MTLACLMGESFLNSQHRVVTACVGARMDAGGREGGTEARKILQAPTEALFPLPLGHLRSGVGKAAIWRGSRHWPGEVQQEQEACS